ncbi:putative sulfate exporter family transporter [Roseomonas sp. NAR14]|uniref:Sulfate exporter family transporter n=1 Tax=Roseomonas acroporae TaxID=2937791 RepID=A0A9X1YDF6_9PROT|nr:putative sulfate exporter family transporter [Roseomonas acroporae]MCK8786677.1 putative sulfate exporter family transporter [Roseomonas acroporae]
MSAPAAAVPSAGRLRSLLPGLALSTAIALLATFLRNASGLAALNPVVVALVLGVALRAAIGPLPLLRPGIAFAVRPVLRAAIVLLGLQVTLGQLLGIGAGALGLAAASVALTLPFTIWLGRQIGVEAPLAQLIGTGTAICGASAIVAANQVARGREEDVAYALAVITLCGTAAMLIYPLLGGPLGLDARAYGLWAGASVHEVVQAVGAAAAGGPVATEVGTVAKLARVVLLAPAVLALGFWVGRGGPGEGPGGGPAGGPVKAPVPWFAFGFLALVALGSTGLVPPAAVAASRWLVPLMLAASVAGLGLSTDIRALRMRGAKPLLLGVAASLFISALALIGVALLP